MKSFEENIPEIQSKNINAHDRKILDLANTDIMVLCFAVQDNCCL